MKSWPDIDKLKNKETGGFLGNGMKNHKNEWPPYGWSDA